MKLKLTHLLGFGSLGLILSPYLLELITYSGSIKSKLGVPAMVLSIGFILCTFVIRKRLTFPAKLSYIAAWLTVIVSLILGYIESQHFPNYILSTLHINFQALIYSSLLLFICGLVFADYSWLKKWAPQLIFTSGIYCFLLAWALWFVPLGHFFTLMHEGAVVESLQFFVLLIISCISFYTARRTSSKKIALKNKSLYLTFFILCGLGSLFLAGEEVAWGQHWFGYSIESIQRDNLQNEVTVHNNSFVSQFIFNAYLFVTIYGSFSWLIARILGKKASAYFFIFTKWFTMSFFLFWPLYQLYEATLLQSELVKSWSEYTELMLYIGILFTVIKNYHKIVRLQDH